MQVGYFQYHPEFGARHRTIGCAALFSPTPFIQHRGGVFRPRRYLLFTGQSQIVGPRGEVIASSNSDEEAVVISDVDISEARNKFITDNNNLFADRRPTFYDFIV
jgi:predicted amidohydrolase